MQSHPTPVFPRSSLKQLIYPIPSHPILSHPILPSLPFQVVGLEAYLVDVEACAAELRSKLACSTSVAELPGKNQGHEVVCQGSVIEKVGRGAGRLLGGVSPAGGARGVARDEGLGVGLGWALVFSLTADVPFAGVPCRPHVLPNPRSLTT